MRLSHLLSPFQLIAKLVAVLCVLLVFAVQPVGAQGNTPIRINFDALPNNTVVADQYLNQYGGEIPLKQFFLSRTHLPKLRILFHNLTAKFH